MRGNEELPAELKAFEAELAALAPTEERLDRTRLLFTAGRASVRRRPNVAARAWAGAFAAMTAMTASLLVALLIRPEPPVKIVERIIRVPVTNRIAETKPGVPEPKRSDGPAERELADADPSGLGAGRSRYPMQERTSVLAAVFFGVPDKIAGPLWWPEDRWRANDWSLSDDAMPAAQTAPARQTDEPPQQPTKVKTYRQLFEELTGTHG